LSVRTLVGGAVSGRRIAISCLRLEVRVMGSGWGTSACRCCACCIHIHSGESHLLSIINDVLDLSKAASGKLELVEGWIDTRESVASVCRLIQPRIDEAKLSLTVNMPPSGLITYADDRLQADAAQSSLERLQIHPA
jgi:hypothetical protein